MTEDHSGFAIMCDVIFWDRIWPQAAMRYLVCFFGDLSRYCLRRHSYVFLCDCIFIAYRDVCFFILHS